MARSPHPTAVPILRIPLTMTSPLRRRAGSRLMQSCWGPGPAMWLWAERRQNSQRHPARARAWRWLCRVSPRGAGTSASLAGGRRLDLGRLGADAAGTGRYRGLGTEYSLDSRRVDQLHRLVDLEEGLEAWRGGGGREGHGVKRGQEVAVPVGYVSGGTHLCWAQRLAARAQTHSAGRAGCCSF